MGCQHFAHKKSAFTPIPGVLAEGYACCRMKTMATHGCRDEHFLLALLINQQLERSIR
jgi:hypothetical protein